MENLPVNNGNGQAFGYVLYETTIFSSGVLSGLVRDRGQVGASPQNSWDFVVTGHDWTHVIFCLQDQLSAVCRSQDLSIIMAVFTFLCACQAPYSFSCLAEALPPVHHGFRLLTLAGLFEQSVHRILGLYDNEDHYPLDPGLLSQGSG